VSYLNQHHPSLPLTLIKFGYQKHTVRASSRVDINDNQSFNKELNKLKGMCSIPREDNMGYLGRYPRGIIIGRFYCMETISNK
jgi:hypothetical protein